VIGPARAAPVFDYAGALGRVKSSLASLAAGALLTRPARSLWFSNYRSDGGFLTARGLRISQVAEVLALRVYPGVCGYVAG
jgi:hypothetical protein